MLLIVVLTAALSLCQANGGEQYIVGGADADAGEFPWQLSLQIRFFHTWVHECGATVLSNSYGLTAAHCVHGIPVRDLRVIAGLHKQSDLTGTQIVAILEYTVHEHYLIGPAVLANDICILEFADPLIYSDNIKPVDLPDDYDDDFKGATCTITGWGRTDRYLHPTDTLQKASIEAIGTHQCQGFFTVHHIISSNQLCLYDCEQKVGSCTGDGGGPVVCPGGNGTVLAGVGSWELSSFHGVCLQRFPSVYTSVPDYLDWIYDNTDLDI